MLLPVILLIFSGVFFLSLGVFYLRRGFLNSKKAGRFLFGRLLIIAFQNFFVAVLLLFLNPAIATLLLLFHLFLMFCILGNSDKKARFIAHQELWGKNNEVGSSKDVS